LPTYGVGGVVQKVSWLDPGVPNTPHEDLFSGLAGEVERFPVLRLNQVLRSLGAIKTASEVLSSSVFAAVGELDQLPLGVPDDLDLASFKQVALPRYDVSVLGDRPPGQLLDLFDLERLVEFSGQIRLEVLMH